MEVSTKNIHKITGAILMNYMANHYNEEIKHLPIYKQNLKNTINKAIVELTKAEKELFDKIYEIDGDEIGDKLSANLITFIDTMVKNTSFPDFCKLQEIVVAYTLEPELISNVSDEILNKHQKEKDGN